MNEDEIDPREAVVQSELAPRFVSGSEAEGNIDEDG